MLLELRIRNFAIIENLELQFEQELNAITGETGTGKSIILDAISLILGSRADSDLIRTGCDEAVVEALFDISGNERIIKKLIESDFLEEQDLQKALKSDQELLIKRTISRSGKSRIYINGALATLGQLVGISENLVDLCSQHEHQSLNKSIYQMELLDRYANLTALRKKVSEIFDDLKNKQKELAELTTASDQQRLEDFLKFQITEIEQFNPQPNEEEQLAQERKILSGLTQILESCAATQELISGANDEGNASELIQRATKRLSKWVDTDPQILQAQQSLERALVELEECGNVLDRFTGKLNPNPERLNEVEERLSTWSQMKRKYGANYQEIMERFSGLQNELNTLVSKKDVIDAIQSEIQKLKEVYFKTATELSKKRRSAAPTLERAIQKELQELRMAGTEFKINFGEVAENEERWTRDGIDPIEFLFAPNVGEGLRPLGKIASGGELSRLMLSIRRVVSGKGGICVYLFDEIDAGIGGQTAFVVGSKIKAVAKHNQVICITHLAQIAAFAGAHFTVSKTQEKGRTKSQISKLKERDRVDEIARMLGGITITEKSRAHAKELLKTTDL